MKFFETTIFFLLLVLPLPTLGSGELVQLVCAADFDKICYIDDVKADLESEFKFEGPRPTRRDYKELRFRRCDIPQIPRGLFLYFNEVRHFTSSRVNLSILNPNSFEFGSNLTRISLDGNQIRRLVENTFIDCPKVERLLVEENQIEEIEMGTFDGLRQLIILHLHKNRIKWLPEGVFRGLQRLFELELNDNLLETLPEGIFSELNALDSINLLRNPIKRLPDRIFSPVPTRRDLTVFLAYANLTAAEFTRYSDAKIYVYNNSISDVHVGTELQGLDVSNTLVSRLTCDQGELQIIYLYLSNNTLSEFGCISSMKKLRIAYLNGNCFERVLEADFKDLKELSFLDLGENRIKTFDGKVFGHLPRVTFVRLPGNLLTELSLGENDAPQLRTLELWDNPWKCDSLRTIVRVMKNRSIEFVLLEKDFTPVTEQPSVEGIRCIE